MHEDQLPWLQAVHGGGVRVLHGGAPGALGLHARGAHPAHHKHETCLLQTQVRAAVIS